MNILLKKVDRIESNNIYTINKLLSAMDYEEISNRAYDISIRWYQGLWDFSYLNANNIDITPVAQLDIYNIFNEYLTAIKVYEKLINLDKNTVILDNSNKHIIKILKKINMIKGDKINFKLETNNLSIKNVKNTFLQNIKRNYKENFIKYLLGLFYRKKYVQENILIFADVYNIPTNNMLNLISGKIGMSNTVITSEPRISYDFFMGNGIPLGKFIDLPLIFNFLKERFIWSKKLKNIKIKDEEIYYPDIPINNLIINEFQKEIIKLFSPFLFDNFLLHNMITKLKPKVILLGTDCHRLSRHLVLISKQYHIKSIVMQHGATNGKYGFTPLFANRIAVWGEISKGILINWGIKEKDIVITGNPRFQDIHSHNIKNTLLRERLRILIALSPYENDVLLEILTLILEAVKKIEGIDIIIKPHPSEKNIHNYREIIKRYSSSLKISLDEKSPANDLLINSDVVISAQSTIGIEALLFGKVLIEIESKRILKKIPYEKFNCCYQVRDTIDLISAIDSIKKRDSQLHSVIGNSSLFLFNYLGDPNINTYGKIREIINDLIGD